MRIGFITSVRLGLECLETLVAEGVELSYLGTIHDEIARTKSGRVLLDDFAAEHAVPLHKFRNMNDADAVAALRAADLDWLYVIGWSQMARAEVLSVPRLGAVGIHPTLLPLGRGRASIPWAIIKGLAETGVSMFKLDEGMDTGPLLGQVTVPIGPAETSTTLYEKVIVAHRTLIRDTLPGMLSATIELHEQDHSQATEWPGRTPADGAFVPAEHSVAEIDRFVRALTHPYPGAFVEHEDGSVLRVWAGRPGGGYGLELVAADGIYSITEHAWEFPGSALTTGGST